MSRIVTLHNDPALRQIFLNWVVKAVDQDGGEAKLEPMFLELFGFGEEGLAGVAREAGLGFEVRNGHPTFWRAAD